MPGDRRQILSLLRLPIPPLQLIVQSRLRESRTEAIIAGLGGIGFIKNGKNGELTRVGRSRPRAVAHAATGTQKP